MKRLLSILFVLCTALSIKSFSQPATRARTTTFTYIGYAPDISLSALTTSTSAPLQSVGAGGVATFVGIDYTGLAIVSSCFPTYSISLSAVDAAGGAPVFYIVSSTACTYQITIRKISAYNYELTLEPPLGG